jgi:NADPH-dependent 2,4-dienoyl-CoA reductase/sulfur reductase-like enzyme
VKVRHRVEGIHPNTKTLSVRDTTTGEAFEDRYDRLVVATGARAVLPPIPGADLDGIFPIRFLTDTDRIMEYVRERSPERALIVGGGYIGLEVAENLCRMGMEVALVEGEDRVALAYGNEVSERVEAELEAHGVGVFTGEKVEEFVGDGRVRAVRFGGKEREAELVILGVGIQAERGARPGRGR